ncbi:ABC transporter ATP-binding protein [Ferroacidibacillus organovorans]|uniref:Multidrug ABC transporter ATP-binding protein n=1 Tax=Ferroacidibacillus organovorans TaxID=1765683 RepID=A0A101XNV6_9BACL|nr:ABC transporter ATP-binding protein [Ferroacidibacillus organovorans]KUO94877.1 multidrug ABC transporter ATP-binding protein [Ferroacidibacillus organovorans]
MRLLSYLRPHVWALCGAFVLLAIATATDVLGPLIIKNFIDHYLTVNRFPTGPLVRLASLYVILLLITASFNFMQVLAFQTLALRIIQRIRIEVYSKVQDLALAFFDKTPAGSLVSRITNDTEAIQDLFMSVLSTFVQNLFLLTGIYISLFFLNVRLAMLCLLLIPLIATLMQVYRTLSTRVYHLSRQKLSQLNAKLNESLQGMYIIQAMRQERRLRDEFGEINQAYRRVRVRNIKINGLLLRPMVDVLYMMTLMLVLWFFGVRSLTHVVDLGVLYAFVNYLERFFEPINNMMMRLNLFQQSLVAATRVFILMDETELAPRGEGLGAIPETGQGKIEFRDVSFSYDGENDVLKNISFTALPGQTVALVGHTGSGKSTTINLLMRFYPVTRGQILVDDVPLHAYPNDVLRSRIGLVLQDPFLFVGDMRHNIRLGGTDITDEEVEAAAAFVQADRFIKRMPKGYEEMVAERGATLSSGQRQLLSFARTMVRNPKVLVLDEATASVDTETEVAIQEALSRMRHGRTTIAIAHRLSTIQDADQILVFHHGEIVERGTHQDLLARRGLYYNMYLLQKGGSSLARHHLPIELAGDPA